MGSVYQKDNGWAIRYELPGSSKKHRRRGSMQGFLTEEHAEKALEQIEAQLKLDIYDHSDDKTTLSDVVMYYLENHVELYCAPSTNSEYHRLYDRHIENEIGCAKIKTLKPSSIKSFYNRLSRKGIAYSTVSMIHSILTSAFTYAYRDQLIDVRLMDQVKFDLFKPKSIQDKHNYWTPDVIDTVLPDILASSLAFNAYVALFLGLRAEETAAIHVDDLSFTRREITIRHAVKWHHNINEPIRGQYIRMLDERNYIKYTKNGIVDILPMTDSMYSFLKTHLKQIKENQLKYGNKYIHTYDGFLSVFPNGKLITDRYVSNKWAELMTNFMHDHPEVNKITFHGLRHSCASWLLANDVDMKTIQVILRHSNMKMTSDVYSHLDTKQKMKALKTLHS